jgi:hypothetical protein
MLGITFVTSGGYTNGAISVLRRLHTVSEFDVNRAIAHLNMKWGLRPCPMCGISNWNVQGRVFQLMEFNEGNLVLGGQLIPVVPIICNNCGNTVLVNAIVAGIVPPGPEVKK